MDFAASKGKSMILNRITSAIVAPLLHNDEILGVLWLDSESLAQFQQKDMEIATAIAAQAAMFIEINILAKKIEQEIVKPGAFQSPAITQCGRASVVRRARSEKGWPVGERLHGVQFRHPGLHSYERRGSAREHRRDA